MSIAVKIRFAFSETQPGGTLYMHSMFCKGFLTWSVVYAAHRDICGLLSFVLQCGF